MHLIYTDPGCSGLQVIACNKKEDIEDVLSKAGLSEDDCGGDVIYYVYIGNDNTCTMGELDYT